MISFAEDAAVRTTSTLVSSSAAIALRSLVSMRTWCAGGSLGAWGSVRSTFAGRRALVVVLFLAVVLFAVVVFFVFVFLMIAALLVFVFFLFAFLGALVSARPRFFVMAESLVAGVLVVILVALMEFQLVTFVFIRFSAVSLVAVFLLKVLVLLLLMKAVGVNMSRRPGLSDRTLEAACTSDALPSGSALISRSTAFTSLARWAKKSWASRIACIALLSSHSLVTFHSLDAILVDFDLGANDVLVHFDLGRFERRHFVEDLAETLEDDAVFLIDLEQIVIQFRQLAWNPWRVVAARLRFRREWIETWLTIG